MTFYALWKQARIKHWKLISFEKMGSSTRCFPPMCACDVMGKLTHVLYAEPVAGVNCVKCKELLAQYYL